VAGLAERLPFVFSVSMTTRQRRPIEVDGVDYHFVDVDSFEQAVAAGDLVEWAEFGGNLYGTPASFLEDQLATGHDVLVDIEIVGARNIKHRFPEAIIVWIDAPNRSEREHRLRFRGDTSDEDVRRRLDLGEQHSREARELFEHFIVNDQVDVAIDQVTDILAPVPESAEEI
jgi:guanylate kinase